MSSFPTHASSARRIALLIDPLTAAVAGARHLRELSRALERAGHVVRAFGAPAALLEESAAALTAGRTARAPEVGASVLAFAPDFVVAYDSLSPAAWLGARLAKRLGVPLYLIEAGVWGDGQRVQRALWRIGERLWGRYVRRQAAQVLALDVRAQRLALGRGFPAARVVLWPHGVDLQQFQPGLASLALVRRHVRGRVLTCPLARDGEPEFALLLEAFAATVGRREDWSLVFTSREPLPRLRRLAQRLTVAAHVHFLPHDEPELPALYAASTLIAVPHGGAHNLALEFARALASGVTVLASDTDIARSLIEPEQNGLLAPAGEASAWTELLRRAASSPEVRRRIARSARATAEQRWSWTALTSTFDRALAAQPARELDEAEASATPEPTH